jgi:hypothetical protein
MRASIAEADRFLQTLPEYSRMRPSFGSRTTFCDSRR